MDTFISPTIREADPRDAAVLARLAEDSFGARFSDVEERQAALDRANGRFSVARIEADLVSPDVTTLLAFVGLEAVAYAQIWRSHSPSGIEGASVRELRRFYVLSGYHGTGVAHELMAAVSSCASNARITKLWLGVEPDNVRAIRFYLKWGFEPAGEKRCSSSGSVDLVLVSGVPLRRRVGRGVVEHGQP